MCRIWRRYTKDNFGTVMVWNGRQSWQKGTYDFISLLPILKALQVIVKQTSKTNFFLNIFLFIFCLKHPFVLPKIYPLKWPRFDHFQAHFSLFLRNAEVTLPRWAPCWMSFDVISFAFFKFGKLNKEPGAREIQMAEVSELCFQHLQF